MRSECKIRMQAIPSRSAFRRRYFKIYLREAYGTYFSSYFLFYDRKGCNVLILKQVNAGLNFILDRDRDDRARAQVSIRTRFEFMLIHVHVCIQTSGSGDYMRMYYLNCWSHASIHKVYVLPYIVTLKHTLITTWGVSPYSTESYMNVHLQILVTKKGPKAPHSNSLFKEDLCFPIRQNLTVQASLPGVCACITPVTASNWPFTSEGEYILQTRQSTGRQYLWLESIYEHTSWHSTALQLRASMSTKVVLKLNFLSHGLTPTPMSLFLRTIPDTRQVHYNVKSYSRSYSSSESGRRLSEWLSRCSPFLAANYWLSVTLVGNENYSGRRKRD